jgi:hypothetical protein
MSNNARVSHWPRTSQVGYNGADAVVYDDLQVSASQARLPAANAPTWRTFDYGIPGGVLFDVLGFAINDTFTFKVQTTHATKLFSYLGSHIHWTLPSNSAGDRIKFQLDVIAAPVNEFYAVPAGSPYTVEHVLDGTEYGKHRVLGVASVPEVNTTVSTIYQCRLTRVVASANDYAGEVYLDYNDSHIQKDTVGSILEWSKG